MSAEDREHLNENQRDLSTNEENNQNISLASPLEDTEVGMQEDQNTFKLVKRNWRETIFLTLTESTYSTFAYCLSFYFDGLVALSMVFMCSETVTAWSKTPQQQMGWRILEVILTANFLVDFVLKVLTAEPLLKYIIGKPTFVIDLLGILPFFIERIVEQFGDNDNASVKALRVLRLLRFFRLSRIAYENFPDFRMFIQAIRRSKLAIAFLGMYVFGAGLFFASCIYYAETSECLLNSKDNIWYYPKLNPSDPDEPCSVQNIFDAWWFTLVTMTTVGYGDTNVASAWGKILTILIMIGSLIFLALPSAIFAANLTEMYLERRLMKKITHHHGNHDSSPSSPALKKAHSHQQQRQHVLTPTEDAEIRNLLLNVDAAGEQIQAALSSLSSHLSFIQHQQQQLQNLLSSDPKRQKDD